MSGRLSSGAVLFSKEDEELWCGYCRVQAQLRGDYRTAAVLLERGAQATPEPEVRAGLHREAARIAEEHLDDSELALAQWQQLLSLEPESSEPRQQMPA